MDAVCHQCTNAVMQAANGIQQAQSNLMIVPLSRTYSFYYGFGTIQKQIIRLDISDKKCRII